MIGIELLERKFHVLFNTCAFKLETKTKSFLLFDYIEPVYSNN